MTVKGFTTLAPGFNKNNLTCVISSSALPANARLGQKWLAMTNTLAYCGMELSIVKRIDTDPWSSVLGVKESKKKLI